MEILQELLSKPKKSMYVQNLIMAVKDFKFIPIPYIKITKIED